MQALQTQQQRPSASASGNPSDDQYVAFRCGDTDYGIPIMSVREIRRWQPTTLIPGRGATARGVLDIRGTVVEVSDLAALLGGRPIEPVPGSVVLIVSVGERLVGVLVDAVSDIIQAEPEELMPVPPNSGHRRPPVSGMVAREERLIAILDLTAMLN